MPARIAATSRMPTLATSSRNRCCRAGVLSLTSSRLPFLSFTLQHLCKHAYEIIPVPLRYPVEVPATTRVEVGLVLVGGADRAFVVRALQTERRVGAAVAERPKAIALDAGIHVLVG